MYCFNNFFSPEEVKKFFASKENTGEYARIFDRKNTSVARYLKQGHFLASPDWVRKFATAGGRFDFYGIWGIKPNSSMIMENQGICPVFAAEMLQLLGRADYDFRFLKKIWDAGLRPQKKSEFHAFVRGIERKKILEDAQVASEKIKSIPRLGWMPEKKFQKILLEEKIFNFNYFFFPDVLWESVGLG